MDPLFLFLVFLGLFAAFVGLHYAGVGARKLGAYFQEHPLVFGLIFSAAVAVMISVWMNKNSALVECFPQHKFACLLPGR